MGNFNSLNLFSIVELGVHEYCNTKFNITANDTFVKRPFSGQFNKYEDLLCVKHCAKGWGFVDGYYLVQSLRSPRTVEKTDM